MLQWISRQREVMEQFPAASSSHPAPREYDRDLQCPSLSGEQEELTYLQVERWPRYAAYEDERQDNSEARRNPIVQNAPPFMEKEPKEDSDSEREERYFRKIMDKTKAKFALTESDWETITVRNYPGGGRFLGGDWCKIFHSKLKQSNPWCNLRFKNNHVRSRNLRNWQSAPFFRGSGECKRPECGVKVKFYIQEEKGKYVEIVYSGDICHKFGN
ncbi:uncharacterized protein [Montipora capricornis]